MSKRTIALIVILVLITAVLTSIAISPKKTAPTTVTTQNKTTPTVSPAKSILTLYPSNLTISSGSGSLDVRIDTRENKVTAVQLELSYDPQMVINPTIVPGSFFANPVVLLKNIDQKNGRISYALGISPSESGIHGIGPVAIISFQTKMTPGTKTSINFLPKTMVTAEGVMPSVLKTSTGATITFVQSAGSTVNVGTPSGQ